jgi:hypothetical protein
MHRHTRWNLASILALTLSIAALVVALIAAPGFASPSPQQQQQMQSLGANPFPPMSPDRPNFGPPRIPQPELGENNAGPMLQQNQTEMKKDIDQLYAMVSQLKQQSDKTNSAQVLSLALVAKAKKIQTLAKKIGNLAKGS